MTKRTERLIGEIDDLDSRELPTVLAACLEAMILVDDPGVDIEDRLVEALHAMAEANRCEIVAQFEAVIARIDLDAVRVA